MPSKCILVEFVYTKRESTNKHSETRQDRHLGNILCLTGSDSFGNLAFWKATNVIDETGFTVFYEIL